MLKTLFKKQPNDLIYQKDNVSIFFLTVQELHERFPVIENWKKNRKPDEVRITQIKEQYLNNNEECLVDGMISAWKSKDCLYIYDGIHRYEATKSFEKNKILIKIIETNDENIIKDDFKKINLSISIPYIFLEDQNEIKVSVCNKVSDFMITNWPRNQMSSRNPWRCNYNRDVMVENIFSQLEIDFTRPNIDKLIIEALKHTNNQAKIHIVETNRKDVKQKAYDTHFFIRYLTDEVIRRKMETYINTLT